MLYQCDRCGAPLAAGTRACAVCGRLFDAPVPADAETPPSGVDAVLQGRTAAGAARPNMPGSAGVGDPAATLAPARPPRLGLWIGLGATLVLLVLLGGIVRGAYLVWTRGPGGSMSFMEANNAGNDAFARGDFVTANADYSRMIALRPDRVDGYMLRGICEFQQRQLMRSIADDTAGLARTSDQDARADLLDNRAQAEDQRGSLTAAIADYTAAEAAYRQITDPNVLPEARQEREANLRLRSQAYLAHKDYARSIADCTALIAGGNTQPDDFFNRGKAEAALGQDTAAWADMGRAIEKDPSDAPCQVALENLADQTHKYAQAVAILQQATAHYPQEAGLWGSLGWLQYEAGQIPAATLTDRHAQSLDSSQGWINFNLALCYAVTGNAAKATAAYAFALASARGTDRQGAISDLQHALARQPHSVPIQMALAQVQRGAAGLPAPPPPPAPNVSPRFASMIAPQVSLGGFTICPPRGYVLQQTSDRAFNGMESTALWSGPTRADGTLPTLQVYEAEDDGTTAEQMNATQAMQTQLSSLASNHTHLTTTPITPCGIGGRQFVRAGWTGIGQRTGKPYAGAFYVFVESGHLVMIQIHDEVPYSHTSMPILNASVLTFRKL